MSIWAKHVHKKWISNVLKQLRWCVSDTEEKMKIQSSVKSKLNGRRKYSEKSAMGQQIYLDVFASLGNAFSWDLNTSCL